MPRGVYNRKRREEAMTGDEKPADNMATPLDAGLKASHDMWLEAARSLAEIKTMLASPCKPEPRVEAPSGLSINLRGTYEAGVLIDRIKSLVSMVEGSNRFQVEIKIQEIEEAV